MKKIILLFSILLFTTSLSHAQNWLRDMNDNRVNFFTVQKEFNQWWELHKSAIVNEREGEESKFGESWKIYKRWEHDMIPRMIASGGIRGGVFDSTEYAFFEQKSLNAHSRSGANWTYIGPPHPFDVGDLGKCVGRINCVRFDPVNPNVIYAGAPSGGLWKSSDRGQTWQLLNTDNLTQIGVSDVVINPYNTQKLFIATGDKANYASLSTGIKKSLNGGQTWVNTNLTWTSSSYMEISRLLISPLDTNILFAASNAGIYRTLNGGILWTKVLNVPNFNSMEFKPGNPQTIYASNNKLYKSVNGGTTWIIITSGLPDSSVISGMSLAVTPADTDCVYILAGDTGTTYPGYYYLPYQGVFRSLDGGNNFTLQSTTPDANGNQGTYDLNLGVSPTDRDVVICGSVYLSYSTDGGVNWNTNFSSMPHVDHHDIRFLPGSGDTVFSANDGGLFLSTDQGISWTGLNQGIHIGQLYCVSSSEQHKYIYATGRQDEGTLLQKDSTSNIVYGGDGLTCVIDPTDDNIMYYSYQFGGIGKTIDGGATVADIVSEGGSGVNAYGGWNTPIVLNPQNSNTVFIAKDYVYQSPDGGATWNQLNSPPLPAYDYYNNYYLNLAVAPSDTNYIYAATYDTIFKSTDGGQTFIDISQGLVKPIYALVVSYTDPNKLWVATQGNRVYYSINGGQTWVNHSTGLPSSVFNVSCLALLKNSPNALYAGFNYGAGVYYIDSTMSSWVSFSAGLPNVSMDDLKISYCTGKIRAATYGRDLWESDLYNPWYNRPVAQIQSDNTNACLDTIHFTDVSSFNPTSWQWFFPGAVPVSSTLQNPQVVYTNAGTYPVTLIATNQAGSDTTYANAVIDVCAGIEEAVANSDIHILPNPNSGNFTLTVANEARGNLNIRLFDEIGALVYGYNLFKKDNLLNYDFSLSHVSKGVYFLEVTSDIGKSVQKLVIDR